MLYKSNENFILPENESLKIWRFMDFTKFMDVLMNKSLYFTRADKFKDNYDGVYSSFSEKNELNPKVSLLRLNEQIRANTLISCWHLSQYESAAMWELYSKNKDGIAIQTTIKRLKESFNYTKEEIMLTEVKYIDYEIDSNYSNYGFTPLTTKRLSFEHEKEIRAIYSTPDIESKSVDESAVKHGMNIKVDLNKLVENIYIDPTADDFFVELVKDVLKSHACNFNVIKSSLYSPRIK